MFDRLVSTHTMWSVGEYIDVIYFPITVYQKQKYYDEVI